jgi:hypothetical protein
MENEQEHPPPPEEEEQEGNQIVNIPPPIFIPQYPLYHVHKIYPFTKTRKTEDMMETMAKQNKIPSIMIDDPFMNSDTYKLSFCTKDFIDEWVRTTQILLFDQFQESMRNWTEITKGMKQEIFSIKYERKKTRHWRTREQIETRAQTIDTENIRKLPDELVHYIWSYVDEEIQNKYFLGKYCLYAPLFKNMLQKLNFQTLKTIYKKTALCYHGLCMQKTIPRERFNNPPVNRKNKQDFIRAITTVIDDYFEMYTDEYVFTTRNRHGDYLTKKEGYNLEESDYFGIVFPLDFYEKRTLKLWKHLAVAFSHFLPTNYYHSLCQQYSPFFPQPLQPKNSPLLFTPPLLHDTPPSSPDNSIEFILL